MKEYRILFTGVGRRVELMQAFRDGKLIVRMPACSVAEIRL